MKNYIYILGLILLFSCDEINLQVADTNVPVVEAYIHPGEEVLVSVRKQFVYNTSDTSIQYLDDLLLSISDGENDYLLTSTDSGRYVSADIAITAGQEYTLLFDYNEKAVSALTEIPSKPSGFSISSDTIEAFSFSSFDMSSGTRPEMPDPVVVTYSNPDSEYHMIVVECVEDKLVLINESTDTDRPMPSFRTQPMQGAELELRFNQFEYLGTHRVLLYKLNPEYAALYEQMETTSLDIEAPPSNVENGLGIFTGMNTDTLLVEVVLM